MSPQDTQLLQDFLSQLTQVRGIAKDPEADAMISRAVAQQPDAAYLLVQRALLMDQALNNAKAQIATLENQLRGSQQSSPSFLDPNAWGNSGVSRPAQTSQPAPAYQQPYQPPYQQQPYQEPPQAYAQGGSPGFLRGGMGGMGGLLGNVAATAAGVAGGAFLFQGLEHLLGNHGGGLGGHQSGLASVPDASEHAATASHAAGTQGDLADKFGLDMPSDLSNPSGSDSPNSLADNLGSDLGDSSDFSDDDSLI